MRVHGVIPARYRSSRFPGKALALIGGKALVQHVYERARSARRLSRLLVATDDERIARAVRAFGGEAVMTSPDHATGTDRMAEVARRLPADVHLNIQGDEPLLEGADLDRLVDCVAGDDAPDMATLARPIDEPGAVDDSNVVKVVCDAAGRALYFSRAPIPFAAPRQKGAPRESTDRGGLWLRHVGIYACSHRFLLEFAGWPPGRLEEIERLEQLRVLEHGRTIRVLRAEGPYLGVDTPDDVPAVERALAARS